MRVYSIEGVIAKDWEAGRLRPETICCGVVEQMALAPLRAPRAPAGQAGTEDAVPTSPADGGTP